VLDPDLVAQFEDTTLPDLPHEDHVRLVWLYTRVGGADYAIERIREGLIVYTAARGSAEWFHSTRTWAWAVLIADATLASASSTFDAFLAQHPQFLRRDLLGDYYSDPLLTSDAARAAALPPDLRPLN
jgi:hypothetical protein